MGNERMKCAEAMRIFKRLFFQEWHPFSSMELNSEKGYTGRFSYKTKTKGEHGKTAPYEIEHIVKQTRGSQGVERIFKDEGDKRVLLLSMSEAEPFLNPEFYNLVEGAREEYERRTEINLNHLGQELIFRLPIKVPGTYAEVKEEIESEGLRVPTLAETVSLVKFLKKSRFPEGISDISELHDAYCANLWCSNGLLYLPNGKGEYNNGVIVQDNPEVRNGKVFMNRSDLIKKLETGDKSVRFVPYGYKTWGDKELEKNPLLIGLAGEEGAESLARIGRTYEDQTQFMARDENESDNEKTCWVSLNKSETEHNQNDPWYTDHLAINCLNSAEDKYSKGTAAGIIKPVEGYKPPQVEGGRRI